MNNPEAELEELRPQLEVIVLSVKLLGETGSFHEYLARAHAAIALDFVDKDIGFRLGHAQSAIGWWKK